MYANDLCFYWQAVISAPVAIYFNVDAEFQHYAGGIYSSTSCTSGVNHAGKCIQYACDEARSGQ